ncbi:MAG: CDP-alcohol phosphatidyltransferase family protein [Actinomycetota bacterium]|nr:CDP-alcohol phosphatidyltransferase family protein [Actinomycetota bacterium]
MLEKLLGAAAQKVILPVGAALARAGFTANLLTLIGFLVVLAASWVIAVGPLPLGGLLLLAGSCFDLLDGAVARVTKKVSKKGAFLDSTVDRVSDAAMFLALVWRGLFPAPLPVLATTPEAAASLIAAQREARLLIGLALAAMILGFLVSYVRARAEGLDFECKVGIAERPERVVIMALGLLLSRPIPALIILVAMSGLTLVQRLVHVWKQASAPAGS